MIQETSIYSCDNCNEEMNKHEYESKAIRITISVYLPNESGKCGEQTGTTMRLCEKCSKEAGLINDQELHKYVYAHSKFTQMVKNCKKSIFGLFKNKLYKEN